MITPGSEDRPFVARWNTLVRSLIVEPSVKLVARTAVEYAISDGVDVYPGNGRLSRETGLSERTVRTAWGVLRELGMAERVAPSIWNGERRTADRYDLLIPARWRGFVTYGPHSNPFTCAFCHSRFDPEPCFGADKRGEWGWFLDRATFCPRSRSGPGCLTLWQADQERRGKPTWQQVSADERWSMAWKARDDEWP